MAGNAMISDSICNGQEQNIGKGDRSKSSGSLPQISKKQGAENAGQKKAEITNVCQVNDFMSF